LDEVHGVVLGHRRLSIIDLSEHGTQPMHSASGRYVVAYNGEIYNFQALRAELEHANHAPAWCGHSDTEVMLACIEVWGFEATLRKLVGMFAIALWDRQTASLLLARDRIGEKPLYYGYVEGCFAFASELKAIRTIAAHGLSIDRDALAEFMRFGYVPAPRSIYSAVGKVPPGHFVTVSAGIVSEPVAYWRLESPEVHSLGKRLASYDDNELVNALHDRLRDAVAAQMVSDVPLGAFLSGGVDSSTIVGLMQSLSDRRVRTYTIGFQDRAFNEAPYARAVAEHLGTEHTEMIVTAADAAGLIQSLPMIYDEPFADSSQIPTALISRLTSAHVTVALSGDGGDEIFAGYPRYQLTAALWRRVSSQPMLLRQAASAALGTISAHGWDRMLWCLPASMRDRINGRRIHRVAQLMICTTLGEMYVRLMSRWQPEDALVIGASLTDLLVPNWHSGQSDIDSMRIWDTQHYLPDDLLVKVDRAAMSASLETRAPMLDHRVVDFAMALPERMLVRDGVGKWALRRVLDRYVPRTLIDRPKAGFEVPLGDWLRGPLRSWAESLLDPSRLKREGYLNAEKIGQMWEQHQSGRWDRSLHLWNVLMFEAWLNAGNNLAP
jgi:asparagine synthase (glutamine-hydrolysing)